MTKDVLVSIKGLQFEGAMDSEEIETITRGEYYLRNQKHYVLYEELMEGCDEPIKNIIRFNEKELHLTKRGMIHTNLIFDETKKSMTNYATPFGDILIGVTTNQIHMKEEEKRIVVKVDYGLEINYEYLTDCTITMDIRPADAAVFPFFS